VKWTIQSADDLLFIARQLLEYTDSHRKWLLKGQPGAGKTTLCAALGQLLHTDEKPSSPTYSIVQEYGLPHGTPPRHIVRHLDLYRLNTIEEALALGIEDMLDDQVLTWIEWPEIIEPLWPAGALLIHIDANDEHMRHISISTT
jgi:tRNA threonylcarbamoyladenosine biosynthesis protein TsaE